VTASVNEVCQRLKNQGKSEVLPSRIVPCSVGAVKNGRRKMEDRHVVFHDINAIYAGHANQVKQSLRSVFVCQDVSLFAKGVVRCAKIGVVLNSMGDCREKCSDGGLWRVVEHWCGAIQ